MNSFLFFLGGVLWTGLVYMLARSLAETPEQEIWYILFLMSAGLLYTIYRCIKEAA